MLVCNLILILASASSFVLIWELVWCFQGGRRVALMKVRVAGPLDAYSD